MSRSLLLLVAAGLVSAGMGLAQGPSVEAVRQLLDTGKYAEAEVGARQLLAQSEAANGTSSREAAEALNLLLVALIQGGKFNTPETMEIARRNLAVREKLYGPDHSEVATSLNSLGGLLVRLGHDEEARPLFERALAIYEPTPERDSRKAFAALSNLGWVLTNIGDYNEANRAYQRALTIAEKNSDLGRMAGALDGQAVAFRHMKNYAEARTNYERAVTIYEKLHGPDDVRVAGPLNNLAQLFLVIGEPQKAKPLLERALAISDKALGRDSYRAADMLAGLGMAEANTGDFDAARPLLERAVELRRKYQSGSPGLAGTESELASLLARTGDFSRALEASLEAEAISRRGLELTARILPERQALTYASTRTRGLDTALSLLAAAAPVSRSMVMDSLIRSRSLVFDEMAARHRVLRESLASETGPEIVHLAQELATSRERLSRLVVEGASSAQALDEASRRKERAEAALGEKSVSFRQELASRRAGIAEVAASLDHDAALVSFVRYNRSPAEQKPSGKIFDIETVPSYMALVLRGGAAEPAAIPLGTSEEIDVLVMALRKQVSFEAMAPGESRKRSEAAYQTAGEALRRRIWDPLATAIGSSKTVYVVPDGSIHLINFAALPAGRTAFLIEKGPLVHYLSAERDLLPVTVTSAGHGLLALGAPAFDVKEQRPASTSARVYRGNPSSCASFHSVQFEPLPASAREADEIAALWKRAGVLGDVRQLSRAAAGEAAFKREAPGKRVLHLATHGFFLGDCPSAMETASGDRAAAVRGENPLLLSGLALAGANVHLAAAGQSEDGILTAEEIAAMDLTGVEWAVLSACETGVGELKAGEGVFGLRRAFQVAGARTVIMSLWPVDDGSTREWMTALYEQRFLKRRGTAEAVREASLELLRRLRSKNQSTHPFYWAGFVAAGDWR